MIGAWLLAHVGMVTLKKLPNLIKKKKKIGLNFISSHIYFSCPSHLSAHWCLAMSFNVCEKNNKERARQYEQERILNLLNESHSSALQF